MIDTLYDKVINMLTKKAMEGELGGKPILSPQEAFLIMKMALEYKDLKVKNMLLERLVEEGL